MKGGMMDLGDTLASDAAQEIVKALVGGLVEVVRKIPSLWRRAGEHREDLIKAEVERSSLALQDAGDDLPAVQARQEGVWEGRLRDLLAQDPDAAAEVRGLLEELERRSSRMPQAVQNITASASGATAQGAMFGQIINYSESTRPDAQTERSRTGSTGSTGEDGQP
jgi:hypothetical protein